MGKKNRTFFEKYRFTTITIVLPVIFFLITGCSSFTRLGKTAKKIVSDIKTPDSGLNKKIGIAPFENRTALKAGDITETFVKDLSDKMKASNARILLIKPGDPEYPDFLYQIPRDNSGKIDNFNLVQKGRIFGFNAIVTGALMDIRSNKKKKGILWFKDVHNFIQVIIAAEVYDTESAAKLMDETFMYETEVDEADTESMNTVDGLKTYVVNAAFQHLAADMSENIYDAVLSHPWRGFITGVSKDMVTIPSGIRAGLKNGDIFEVYDGSETLQGAEGRRFFMPGLKVGEIKITSVDSDKSEAVRISGDNIKPGDCIRPK